MDAIPAKSRPRANFPAAPGSPWIPRVFTDSTGGWPANRSEPK